MQFLRTDPLRLVQHPGWRTGDTPETARLLTPEELIPHGFLPVIDEPPAFNPLRQRLIELPLDDWMAEVKGYRVDDIPLEEARELKLQALAHRRWKAEEGGTTFGGMPIATDRVTQGKVTAAYVKAQMDENYSIPSWKLPTGDFITLDAATIIAIGDTIEAHVQACFTNESVLCTALAEAKTFDDLEAVDINSGWPNSETPDGP